jgi:hypothetical protein
VDQIVKGASVDRCAIRTPGYASCGTPEFKDRHRILPRFISPSHTRTVPSSLAEASSSTPAPPASVLSRELMISRWARSLRMRCPVVKSVYASV